MKRDYLIVNWLMNAWLWTEKGMLTVHLKNIWRYTRRMLTVYWKNVWWFTWRNILIVNHKGKFVWNYWLICVHTLSLFGHNSCKLRRLLFIVSLNVNKIWKLTRMNYQRIFLTKCHIRLLFIYNKVALLWYQRKVKDNTRFSL